MLSIDLSCLEDKHSRYLLRALSSSGNSPSLHKACLQSSRVDKSQWPSLAQWPQDARGQVEVYKYYWVVGCDSPGRRKSQELQTICGGLQGQLKDVLRCLTWKPWKTRCQGSSYFYLPAKMQHHFFLESCLLLGRSHIIRGKLVIRDIYMSQWSIPWC